MTGTLQSPNYPRRYPDGQYCSWRITVSAAQQIYLTFTNFSLQNENNTDGLYVYDGENATGKVLGVYYGGHPPPKEGIYSSSNHMFVIFKSDKNGSYTGFSASYTAFNCSSTNSAMATTSTARIPVVTPPPSVYHTRPHSLVITSSAAQQKITSSARVVKMTSPITDYVMTSLKSWSSKAELTIAKSITELAMTSFISKEKITPSKTQTVITSSVTCSAAESTGMNGKHH